MHKSDGLKANWGGLTSNENYSFNDDTPASVRVEALDQLQNAPERTDFVTWKTNVWYVLEVKKDAQDKTFPPGKYSVLDETPVEVDHPRTLSGWTFTIREKDTSKQVWTKTLWVKSTTIKSITYWTETGYGVTCTDKLRVHWRNPLVGSGKQTYAPTKIRKSLRQSTCPNETSTDIEKENEPQMGTLQTFGTPRAKTSTDGQVLYEGKPTPPVQDAGVDAGEPAEMVPPMNEEEETPRSEDPTPIEEGSGEVVPSPPAIPAA